MLSLYYSFNCSATTHLCDAEHAIGRQRKREAVWRQQQPVGHDDLCPQQAARVGPPGTPAGRRLYKVAVLGSGRVAAQVLARAPLSCGRGQLPYPVTGAPCVQQLRGVTAG